MKNRVADFIMRDRLMRDNRNEADSRRGVRGSGRGKQDRTDNADYERGYEDGYMDARDMSSDNARGDRARGSRNDRAMEDDFHGKLELTKFDMMRWKKMLKNADGTSGPHFEMQDIEHVINKLGIRFDEYSEKEFCMTMNMLYSDLCEAERSQVSPEKEAHHYAKLAQAWLEDDDGPSGSEKLALYFYCIVDDE